ncbi:hypothetical protein D3C87_1914410 [compost metagenome]
MDLLHAARHRRELGTGVERVLQRHTQRAQRCQYTQQVGDVVLPDHARLQHMGVHAFCHGKAQPALTHANVARGQTGRAGDGNTPQVQLPVG